MKPTKELIYELYWNKRLNQKKIAEKLGYSQSWIQNLMKKFDIPPRTSGEAQRGIPKWGGNRKCPWISKSNKEKPRWLGKENPIASKRMKKLWLKAKRDDKIGEIVGRKKHSFICKKCGESFYAPPHKNRVYCSIACQAMDYRERFKGREVTWGDKVSEFQKKHTVFYKLNKDPEFQRKRMKALVENPTNPERVFMEIVEKNGFPFKYVGDGKFFIDRFNPDFIHSKGEKKVIEIFGRAFHDPDVSFLEDIPWYRTYRGRIKMFNQHGYNCIVFWDDELDDEDLVVDKVVSFMEV